MIGSWMPELEFKSPIVPSCPQLPPSYLSGADDDKDQEKRTPVLATNGGTGAVEQMHLP